MRAFKWLAVIAALSLMPSMPAFSRQDSGQGGTGERAMNDNGTGEAGPLPLSPVDVKLDLMTGAAPPSQALTVTYHAAQGDMDVTSPPMYMLADATRGSMSANVFRS